MENWFTDYAANHKVRLAFDFETVQSGLQPSSTIVECGAAPFILTRALIKSDYKVVGLDIAPSRFGESIRELDLVVEKCDIELDPLPFETDSVDCVLFNQLFEHLRINPIKTMRETLRILKPGGQLHLSTPNLLSINGIINLVRRKTAYSCVKNLYAQYAKLESIGHMGHVREYTPEEVSDFLEQTGFTVDEVIHRGSFKNPLRRWISNLSGRLRPHFGIIATKKNVSS